MTCDLRKVKLSDVAHLFLEHHGYGSVGSVTTYVFAVFEDNSPVAAFTWQPPPPGAARAVCPTAPHTVLSLSRMVAVPKNKRQLKHISKPLKTQMRSLVDRTRWPVLVTYSDEGQGHTGYVYQCSGWVRTLRARRGIFQDDSGARVSPYSNGLSGSRGYIRQGYTWLQRWEHRVCAAGCEAAWLYNNGWRGVPTGRVWKSGAPAMKYIKTTTEQANK